MFDPTTKLHIACIFLLMALIISGLVRFIEIQRGNTDSVWFPLIVALSLIVFLVCVHWVTI